MPPAPTFTVGQIDAAAWRTPWISAADWRLHFEGFMYLPALAQRAYLDSQDASLSTMVAQVAAFHDQNPDPGTVQYGWDEGTAQRRLSVENCLFDLTQDSRLRAGMVADANVQLGSRYYGPPYHLVHNHGLMSNLRLLRAGELLGEQAWITTALQRMSSEAPLAFSPQGASWEQSAGYQAFNVALWRVAADRLAERAAYADAAAAIRAVTRRGDRVSQWFTEPDGALVQIGDTDRSPGMRGAGTERFFRDNAAGYVVGRWSWTDPAATYYSIRYGPMRRGHGHFDRGSVTWSVAGLRVLVGPGRYEYNTSSYAAWRQTPAAANVAVPARGTYRDRATSSVISATVQARAHAWLLRDSLYGVTHSRGVNVNAYARRMRVIDSYGGAALRQVWHLDPAWKLVSAPANGQRLVFRHPSGRTLTITTTGRLSGVLRGRTSPVAGWNFPAYGVATPAYQVVLRSVSATLDTSFTVS